MQRSTVSGDLILGGSVGLNRILLYFRDNAYKHVRYEWNIFLVNMFTVFRNVYGKDLTEAQILQAVDTDVGLLLTYFDAYKTAKHPTPPYVTVFYIPTYTKIPEALLRTHTSDAHKQFMDMYTKVCAHLPQHLTLAGEDTVSKVYLAPVGKTTFPHKDLLKIITDQCKPTIGATTPQVLLLSHCPIDLHLSARIQHLSLIESNTGAVKAPNEFGAKLEKSVRIPFHTYTHRLFGDSVHLKPLVVRNEKAKILEVAENNKWYIRSPAEILADIIKHTKVTKASLTDLLLT